MTTISPNTTILDRLSNPKRPLSIRVRQSLRYTAANKPTMWHLSNRLRGTLSGSVTSKSDLVCEGFPRSGNSFAEAALHLCRPGLTLAHHRHVAAQVLSGLKIGVPVLVLIRDPLEAVSSAILRLDGRADPAWLIAEWLQFHTAIKPHLDQIVLSDFPVTTGNFETVLAALNSRYGLGLTPPADLASAAYAEITRISQQRGSPTLNYGTQISAEDKARRTATLQAIREVLIHSYGLQLQRAQALYERVVATGLAP